MVYYNEETSFSFFKFFLSRKLYCRNENVGCITFYKKKNTLTYQSLNVFNIRKQACARFAQSARKHMRVWVMDHLARYNILRLVWVPRYSNIVENMKVDVFVRNMEQPRRKIKSLPNDMSIKGTRDRDKNMLGTIGTKGNSKKNFCVKFW